MISRWRLDGSGPVVDHIAEGRVALGYDPTGEMLLVGALTPRCGIRRPTDHRRARLKQAARAGSGATSSPGTSPKTTRSTTSVPTSRSRASRARPQTPQLCVDVARRRRGRTPRRRTIRRRVLAARSGPTTPTDAGASSRPSRSTWNTPTTVRSMPASRAHGTAAGSWSPPGPAITARGGRSSTMDRPASSSPVRCTGHRHERQCRRRARRRRRAGGVTQYDLETLEPIGTFPGTRGFVSQLGFSADGKILVASSLNQTLSIYDVATRTRLGDPIANEIPFFTGALRPDGKAIATNTPTALPSGTSTPPTSPTPPARSPGATSPPPSGTPTSATRPTAGPHARPTTDSSRHAGTNAPSSTTCQSS